MATGLFTHFRKRAAEHGDRTFIQLQDDEISYGETLDRALAYGRHFEERSSDDPEVIGLFMTNRPEFLYTLFGALSRDMTVACINTEMRGEGLAHLLEKASVTTLVSTDALLTAVEDTVEDSGVEAIRSVSAETAFDPIDGDPPMDPKPVPTEPSGTAVLLHTSGTTGLPKWCDLSHRYFLRLGELVAERFDLVPTDTVFNPLPLYHINPLGYYVFGGLDAGATLGMVEGFSVSGFWDQVRTLGATVVILHMAPKNMILDRTTAEDAAGHDLRVVFPADRTFMQRYDIPKMVTGYGSTEAGGFTHINSFTHVPSDLPDEEDLSAFAGAPRRDVEVRLVTDDGREAPQGTNGEILVRPSREGVIFDGYFNAPDRTVEAWSGLWYHTGDLGYVDEDGQLHYVGRIADSISHKGEFVNVDLVESALESQPGVAAAVVVGVPDDVVGERVKACLVREADVDPQRVIDAVAPDLPSYMVPEYIELLEEFPRIEGTEKINRTALSDRGTADATEVGSD